MPHDKDEVADPDGAATPTFNQACGQSTDFCQCAAYLYGEGVDPRAAICAIRHQYPLAWRIEASRCRCSTTMVEAL